jgi:hypothetical protein
MAWSVGGFLRTGMERKTSDSARCRDPNALITAYKNQCFTAAAKDLADGFGL